MQLTDARPGERPSGPERTDPRWTIGLCSAGAASAADARFAKAGSPSFRSCFRNFCRLG